jgi:basic membrane lipoprotein Med (substrate-binding protein (PBP1-ABC) superfamily)
LLEEQKMRWPNWRVLVTLAVVVVAAVVAGLALSGTFGGGPLPAARARVYVNVDACLLTGSGGVSDPAVAPVWAGMEQASLSTRVRVSFLSVPGPATEANAAPFLGSLLVRGCRVIFASGNPERAAVLADAGRFPAVKFVIFGAARAPSNVTVLAFTAAGGVQSSVANVMTEAVRQFAT